MKKTAEAIEQLSWDIYSQEVSWVYKGQKINKKYRNRVQRALVLQNDNAVLIVASSDDEGRNNASIFEGNGAMRCKVDLPVLETPALGFIDAYYSDGELHVVIETGTENYPYDKAGILEPNSNMIRDLHDIK